MSGWWRCCRTDQPSRSSGSCALAMDVLVAEAVLEFADDGREAAATVAAASGRSVSPAALAGQDEHHPR